MKENLEELINECNDMFGNRIKISNEELARVIVDTRNYIGHNSKGKNSKTSSGNELFWLTEIVKYLLLYKTFLRIGINSKKIKESLRNKISKTLLSFGDLTEENRPRQLPNNAVIK